MTETGDAVPLNDDYHEFLMCNWHAACASAPLFRLPITAERTRFDRGARPAPLREVSMAMLDLDTARSADWTVMRDRLEPMLSPDTMDVMDAAATSSPHFPAYFEGFARAGGA